MRDIFACHSPLVTHHCLKEAGLTQHQVSAIMGRSPNFLTRCESGDRSIDVMELLEFAQIYKKPIHHFFPRP